MLVFAFLNVNVLISRCNEMLKILSKRNLWWSLLLLKFELKTRIINVYIRYIFTQALKREWKEVLVWKTYFTKWRCWLFSCNIYIQLFLYLLGLLIPKVRVKHLFHLYLPDLCNFRTQLYVIYPKVYWDYLSQIIVEGRLVLYTL